VRSVARPLERPPQPHCRATDSVRVVGDQGAVLHGAPNVGEPLRLLPQVQCAGPAAELHGMLLCGQAAGGAQEDDTTAKEAKQQGRQRQAGQQKAEQRQKHEKAEQPQEKVDQEKADQEVGKQPFVIGDDMKRR